MFLTPPATTNSKYHSTLLLFVVICSLVAECCYAKISHRYSLNINPNMPCPDKYAENVWPPCENGGYIAANPNPQKCGDRYICYRGLNESCNRDDRCADNAICTGCGICQKCDSPDNCSEFELCPNYAPYGYQTASLIKRFLQKSYGKINRQ